jgi:signal transduction histidine kinase
VRALGPRSYICVPLIARGRTLGALAFITTESDRRYTADEVALAEEVARRAAIALDNTRLYQEAQDAIRIRDQFLSIAAHELKTPLTSLLGYSQALLRRSAREGTLNQRDQRTLQLIAEQSKRLAKLIELLLDVARIQLGRLDIERRPLDLCALARRLVEEARPTLDRHTLALQCEEQPLVFEGDELRIEQVFQNLLQNAVKYSPAGGPIVVRAERRGDWACLVVGDQGIGIPAVELPNLFQRFFRPAMSTRSRSAGWASGCMLSRRSSHCTAAR